MSGMKISEVLELPMVCEEGDGYLHSNDLRYSIAFDDSDLNMMTQKQSVAHAINTHDRMVEEIVELKFALKELVECSEGNEEQLNELLMCSDYGESKALCDARQLLVKLQKGEE